MVVMTLQRPVKVMDGDGREANCLCGKFIGGCLRLRGALTPGRVKQQESSIHSPVEMPWWVLSFEVVDAWVDSRVEQLFFKGDCEPHPHPGINVY